MYGTVSMCLLYSNYNLYCVVAVNIAGDIFDGLILYYITALMLVVGSVTVARHQLDFGYG
jgi:hypothetical protein